MRPRSPAISPGLRRRRIAADPSPLRSQKPRPSSPIRYGQEERVPMMQIRPSSIAPYVAAMALGMGGEAELCQAAEPAYLSDRGDGIPTSLLGTYIREKEFIFYPFFEYTRFKKFEYKPSELGFTGEQEYFGKLVEREALVFLAYAFNDSLAIEFESAVHASADFTKAPGDA